MALVIGWVLYLVLLLEVNFGAGGKMYYIVTEHAVLTHTNPKYIQYVNFTSRRHGRRSLIYYVDIHYQSLVPFNNTFKVDFYFFEFLSNEYRRGFVEMHFKLCGLIHEDPFFGAAMKQGKLAQPCPYPPGDYHMYNMSIPSAAIPPEFPFTKGRIIANITHRGEDVVGGYIDMELKQKPVRSKSRYPNKLRQSHFFLEEES